MGTLRESNFSPIDLFSYAKTRLGRFMGFIWAIRLVDLARRFKEGVKAHIKPITN